MSNSHSLEVWTRPLEPGCAGCGCSVRLVSFRWVSPNRWVGCGCPVRPANRLWGVEVLSISDTVTDKVQAWRSYLFNYVKRGTGGTLLCQAE